MLVDTEQILRPSDITINIDDDRFNFDENFVRVSDEDDDIWLYIDYGNLSKEVDYTILPRQKGKVINAMLIEFENWYEKSELVSLPTDTVYEWFRNACDDLDDFLEYCSRYNIKTVRDSYVEFELSGYSQGESVTVIVNPSEAEKVWGNTVENGAVTKDGLFQMFFDSTYNVRIDVMGAEFISEQDGSYDYDKDDLIAEMVAYFEDEIDNMEYFKEQLEDLIPSEPK